MPLMNHSMDCAAVWSSNNALKPVDELTTKCQLCTDEIPSSRLLFHMAIHFMNLSQTTKPITNELNSVDEFFVKYSRQLISRKVLIDRFKMELNKNNFKFDADRLNMVQTLFLLAIEIVCQNEAQFSELHEFLDHYWFRLDDMRNDQSTASRQLLCSICHYRFILHETRDLHMKCHQLNNEEFPNEHALIRCLQAIQSDLVGLETENLMRLTKSSSSDTQDGNSLGIIPPLDPYSLINLSLPLSTQFNSWSGHPEQLDSNFCNMNSSRFPHCIEAGSDIITSQESLKSSHKHDETTFDPQNQSETNKSYQQPKRSRTRLSETQLMILRSYFDINNSPSEEKLDEICAKTGLPDKVVKHWFRNTLFKERQRNKDNPYNFSIPPSTCLNLEEYEKTGRIEVHPTCLNVRVGDESTTTHSGSRREADCSGSTTTSGPKLDGIFSTEAEGQRESQTNYENDSEGVSLRASDTDSSSITGFPLTPPKKRFCPTNRSLDSLFTDHVEFPLTGQASSSKDVNFQNPSNCSLKKEPSCPRSASLPHNQALTSPIDQNSSTAQDANVPLDLSTHGQKNSNCSNEKQNLSFQSTSPPYMSNTCVYLPQNLIQFDSLTSLPRGQHQLQVTNSNCGTTSGTRRNRTSITVLQSQCMHAIYSHHKTPSVNECDRLGSVIGLTRRVVQVWFQNQRAKEKKLARVTSVYTNGTMLHERELKIHMKSRSEMDSSYCNVCRIPINLEGIRSPQRTDSQFGEVSTLHTHATFVDHLFSQTHLKRLISCCSMELNPNGKI